MTYDEFLRHIERAGLKIHQFAELVKMNHVSISNYGKKGEVPSHLAIIAVLTGEMAAHHSSLVSELVLNPTTNVC